MGIFRTQNKKTHLPTETPSPSRLKRAKAFVHRVFRVKQKDAAKATDSKISSSISKNSLHSEEPAKPIASERIQAPQPRQNLQPAPLEPSQIVNDQMNRIIYELYTTENDFIVGQREAAENLGTLRTFYTNRGNNQAIALIERAEKNVAALIEHTFLKNFNRLDEYLENLRLPYEYFHDDQGDFRNFTEALSGLTADYDELLSLIISYNKDPAHAKISLNNFISPIQRAPRYLLMLKDFSKHSPENEELAISMLELQNKLNQINEIKGIQEEFHSKDLIDNFAVRISSRKYWPTSKKNARILINICNDPSITLNDDTVQGLRTRLNLLNGKEKRKINKRLQKNITVDSTNIARTRLEFCMRLLNPAPKETT